MACKLDVDLVVKNTVQDKIKNISEIKDGYAITTKDFGKTDLNNISELNNQFGEQVVKYNPPIYNDTTGSIDISISESLYDRYIVEIDKKRAEENTEQAREELIQDAKRAGEEYTDNYLFYSVKPSNEVSFSLKSINILSSPKAEELFKKGNKNNWSLDKILTELTIPKEQKQLILSLGKTNREEIITDLLANYSYAVEVNTAKDTDYRKPEYTYEKWGLGWRVYKNGFAEAEHSTEQSAKEHTETLQSRVVDFKPTEYYSNLTVPGGTNYTENEIVTPGQLVEERPQGISTKQGVPELFESNPELAAIGTQEQYSQYLDQIFPNSKVKDIVYHIGGIDKNSKFDRIKIGPYSKLDMFYFSSFDEIFHIKNELDYLKYWVLYGQTSKRIKDLILKAKTKDEVIKIAKENIKSSNLESNIKQGLNQGTVPWLSYESMRDTVYGWGNYSAKNKDIIRAIVNVINPITEDTKNAYIENPNKGVENIGKYPASTYITIGEYDSYLISQNDIGVKNPEQIHILGSKQDIEGFKRFIKDNTKSVRKNAITPSIKGHAQFSTDNGIGWFRSDDKAEGTRLLTVDEQEAIDEYLMDDGVFPTRNKRSTEGIATKTRRILEVQSDLFQKGRDKDDLIKSPFSDTGTYKYSDDTIAYKNKVYSKINNKYYVATEGEYSGEFIEEGDLPEIVFNGFNKLPLNDGKQNNFLQLLNKDNNWVTFFVKSIIQDSAKQGYEKVLFPSGNTASKVEGHTTLEEFKKQKEDRIFQLKKQISDIEIGALTEEQMAEIAPSTDEYEETVDTPDKLIEAHKNEIDQLEQELERIEGPEGFSALKPIYNFYENTVTNVLKKQGFSPKVITDEYGNTWNEVTIKPEYLENILLSKKTEVEKILTEGDIELQKLIEFIPNEQIAEEKFKNPEVIKRMSEIIDTLGLKTEFAELGEDINAIADIGRRLIQFSKGELTEDNFTEEVIHFVVDILENKNPKLYNELKNSIWKYSIYTQVREEYSKLPQYQINGRPNIDKIKKEAIGQLLVQKLLTNASTQEDKGFLSAIWNTISNWVKALFQNLPNNLTDEFEELANEILTNKQYITETDVNYLSSGGSFAAKKKNSLQKAKYKFGSEKSNIQSFETSEQIKNYILEKASEIRRVTEQEFNPETEQLEDVEYYVTDTGNKQRVTSVLKESSKWLYENIDRSDVAEAIREAKMQKGTDVHKTIEDIVNRFVDKATGKLRTTPIDAPDNIVVTKNIYNILEQHVKERLASYPVDTLFLTEIPVVNEEAGIAGTVDFIAILPNMQVDILDWKTTNILYKKDGVVKKRLDISPFNQKYWREQLQMYKNALISYGISDFRYTRAIPIAVEINTKLIDKKIGWGVASNVVAQILSAKIGNVDTKKIKTEDFLLIPVATRFESTGSKNIDNTIKNLWAIYDRISKTIYSESEKYKKKLEMDRLISTIRELQVKKEASQFKNLFNDAFIRFNKLADENIDFLDTINNSTKFLSVDDSEKINSELKDIYDAIEFLASFGNFKDTIKELYPQYTQDNDPENIIKTALLIDSNSEIITNKLFKKAEKIIEKLATIHGMEDFSAMDIENSDSKLEKFMTSMSQRDEKSIQLAAKMIKAMSFLAKKESEKFFNEESGEFTKVYNDVKAWIKDNKSSLSKVYEYLLAKEIVDFTYKSETFKKDKEKYTKDGVEIKKSDYYFNLRNAKEQDGLKINKEQSTRRLIPKIDGSFFELFDAKKAEFKEFYEQEYKLLSEAGYKGKVLTFKIQERYKAKIMPFLLENYNLSEYDKKYAEALKTKKEQLDKITFDEDVILDELKRNQYLQDWKEQYDIYTSPKALFQGNWLLQLKENKWDSKEYKILKKPENKALLQAFELFENLNIRAKKAGMLDNVPNYWKYIANVEDDTFLNYVKNSYQDFKQLPTTAKAILISGGTLGVGAFAVFPPLGVLTGLSVGTLVVHKYFSKRFTEFVEKYFTAQKPFEEQIDIVTGRAYKNRRVKFKSAEEDSYLSNDLFHVFAQWADHIIKFETVSNYEQKLLMLQMLENKKQKNIAVDSESKIQYYKDVNGIEYKDTPNERKKQQDIEEDLEKIIYNYIYNDDVEARPSFYQLGEYLYRSTMKAFIGFSPLAWLSNLAGAYGASVIQAGNLYSESDLDAGMSANFGLLPKNKKLFGQDGQDKIHFLTSLIQSKIESQYDVDYLNKFKKDFDPTEVIFWGFRKGDHWIQNGISTAILLNTTIVDGKFVNISEHVKKKYETERFKGDVKQRKSVEKKIEKEIQELKTTKNLFHLLEKSRNSFNLKGIDVSSLEGFSELQNLQGRIQSYVKNSIGGVDEFDKSIAQLTWYMKFIMQFKNWLPKSYGTRVQKYRYDSERKEDVYGQYKILTRAIFKDGLFLNVATEGIKALSPLLAYTNPVYGAYAAVGGYTFAKYRKEAVRYEVNVQEAAKNAYQKMKLERIQQGRPTTQTEAEFVDMYINGLINSLNSIRQVATLSAAILIIASLASGGDDEDKKYLMLLAKLFFKVSKELEGDKDIDALMAILNNGIPVLGYLKEIKKLLTDFRLEAEGNIQYYLLNDEQGEEKMKKAHPYHRLVNLTTGRNIHQIMLTLSEDYADYSEVKPAPSEIDLIVED